MKDRVPGAPGQYKAVITPQEQQKLSAAEPFIITLTRDDHPVTEGTPYSKAAVLPDILAASLCPDVEDPTPADAFSALHKKALESIDYPGCYYRVVEGETEWLNPPMLLGEEYRTARRHKGKPVYEKLLDLGQLPAGSAGSASIKWCDAGAEAENVIAWNATVLKEVGQGDEMGFVQEKLPYIDPSTGVAIYTVAFHSVNNVVLRARDTVEKMGNVNLWMCYTKGGTA